ncbi:MAG: bifunctional chorismate mutase/prephenate dehydratase [bacterium]|nr:bifunctional chorismate mutase/prephenate dehydratase [bacterium]
MLSAPDLQALREEIEAIDRDLLAQLKRRMELVDEVATFKIKAAFPFRDQQREEQVLQRVRHAAVDLGLDAHVVERLYRLIMEMSISRQHAFVRGLDTAPLRIAYQGVEGSYSHLTAQRRYANSGGGVLLTGHATIKQAADAVRTGTADAALLPIENSTAGSINETYDELAEGRLTINAEVISQVDHCLLALPGTRLEDLRRVISHPQALKQCEDFLLGLPQVVPEPEFDTAGAARKVVEAGDRSLAAIASESAGEMLGLEILRRGIQMQAANATRFVDVAIEATPCPADAVCKTSLLLALDHSSSNLGEVLTELGKRDIRMTKLESRPIPTAAWKYRFYIDVEAHADSASMVEALESIRPLTLELRLLGTYPKAE